jgi:alkylhydroperoxidase family enzyme
VLLDGGMFTEAELAAVARDYERAGLTAAEVAMMAFAQQVVRDASAITAEDVEGLRRHGLDDAEILDVVLAASARCFLSKTCDGVGAQPDPIFARLGPALREVLVTGRPIQPAG